MGAGQGTAAAESPAGGPPGPGTAVTPPPYEAEPAFDLDWVDLSSADAWRSIEEVEGIDTVEHLRLHRALFPGAAALERLAGLCPRTRVLDLRDCPRLEDAHLAALARFPALEALKLGDNPQLGDRAVDGVLGCRGLVFLELVNATLSGRALARLAELEGLRSLLLGGCAGVDDDCAIALGALREMRDLRLVQCPIGDRAAEGLARLHRLRHLNLNGCNRFGDRGLAGLSALTGLRELRLSGCLSLSDAIWRTLGGFGGLLASSLSFATGLTDAGAAGLEGLPRLLEFRARACAGLGDRAAAALGRCAGLRLLDAAGWGQLTVAGVAAISSLPELERCGIGGLDDDGLEELRRASRLEVLALRDSPAVTPDGLSRLADLPRLRRLVLAEGTPSGAAELEALACLPALEEVAVDQRPDSRRPSGPPEGVAALAGGAALPFRVVERPPGAGSALPAKLTIKTAS